MRWPSWRYDHDHEEAVKEDRLRDIEDAKAEAEQALMNSQQQVAEVRRLAAYHKPIRQRMKEVREKNHFTESILRYIEEGGQ